MIIIDYNKPFEWDVFLSQQKLSSFLQSWEWGEFQKSLGQEVRYLAVIDEENEDILAVCLLIKKEISFKKIVKNYLYSPQGPIVKNGLSQEKIKNIKNLIVEKIREIAQKEKSLFWRFEPLTKEEIFDNKEVKKTQPVQPKDTWLLDLSKEEQTLLSEMHYKTRYNIRLAERRGLIIRQGKDERDVEIFFALLQKTAQREKFKTYSLIYYKNLFSLLRGVGYGRKKEKPFVELFIASDGTHNIAANLVIFFGDRAVYLFGGSDKEYRSLMAPHLLHWTIIKKAKEWGYQYYDFWGIAPQGEENHPWAGLTRFKKSFGGFAYHYPGTFDFVFQPFSYYFYNLFKKLRRMLP